MLSVPLLYESIILNRVNVTYQNNQLNCNTMHGVCGDFLVLCFCASKSCEQGEAMHKASV